MSTVLIAIHDVAPATLNECRRLARWVSDLDASARLTLLAVPRFHGGVPLHRSSECRRWIDARIEQGDEVALHGETHLDCAAAPCGLSEWWARRVMTACEAEFAALDLNDARVRIERSLEELHRCNWHPTGFVPPAWQISASAACVLKEFRFAYYTDWSGIHCTLAAAPLQVPVIGTSSRSAWRRQASRAWLQLALSLHRSAACVRVALHPDDARHLAMETPWRRALEQLLTTRRSMTKYDWVHQSNSVGNPRSR